MLGNGHTVKPKPFENELIIIITSLTFSLVVFVWWCEAVNIVCRKSYPDYKEDDDDESVEMNVGDVDDSSSTKVDESGYQLVLPSGDYWFLYTIVIIDW